MCTQKAPVLNVDTTMLPSSTGDSASQPGNEGDVKIEPPTPAVESSTGNGSPMSAFQMVDDKSRLRGDAVEEIEFDSVEIGPPSIKSKDPKPTLYRDLSDIDDDADFADAAAKIGVTKPTIYQDLLDTDNSADFADATNRIGITLDASDFISTRRPTSFSKREVSKR
jgi:hypothetical protein